MQVVDAAGCRNREYCTWTNVMPNPSAAPTNTGPRCEGDFISFFSNPSGGKMPYTFDWDFGDGVGTSTVQDPVYTYGAAGTYTACVVVTDSAGCTGGSACTTAYIVTTPSTSPANDGPGCEWAAMNFTANPSGGITPYSFNWDFGDGVGFSSLENPSYTYASAGTYSVSLMLMTSACAADTQYTVAVVNDSPDTAPSNNGPACALQPIEFTANPSGGASPYGYWWDFGDGTGTSTARNLVYTYTSGGSYNACVIVTDANGCPGSKCTFVDVRPVPDAAPANTGPVCDGDMMSFSANPSGGFSPYTYSWDFGDGVGTSTQRNPIYTYGSTGTYSACLVVTDSSGCSSAPACKAAVVSPRPEAFPADDGPGCTGSAVSFTANPSGGTTPYLYSWDFGDGAGWSSLENPAYTYAATGIYTASLSVNDAAGCLSATQYTTVTVNPKPSASYNWADNADCSVSFTDTTAGGISPYSYSWDFGDGIGSSTERSPIYTYMGNGSYSVTLTAIDAGGCADTKLDRITVTGCGTPAPCCEVDTLRVEKNGDNIDLTFVYSHGDATYMNVYRGTLGNWFSHNLRVTDNVCPGDDSGDNKITDTNAPLADGNDYYYLAAASNGSCEASYGSDHNGSERPDSTDNCEMIPCP